MRLLFPSRTAKKGQILKKFLTNEEKAFGKLYYCEQCGFPCQEKKTVVVPVYQNAGNTVTVTGDNDDLTITVNSGCPFCGSPRSRKT